MSSKTFDTICERPAHGPEGMAVKLRFLQEQGQYFAHGNWDRTLVRTLQDTVERMAGGAA